MLKNQGSRTIRAAFLGAALMLWWWVWAFFYVSITGNTWFAAISRLGDWRLSQWFDHFSISEIPNEYFLALSMTGIGFVLGALASLLRTIFRLDENRLVDRTIPEVFALHRNFLWFYAAMLVLPFSASIFLNDEQFNAFSGFPCFLVSVLVALSLSNRSSAENLQRWQWWRPKWIGFKALAMLVALLVVFMTMWFFLCDGLNWISKSMRIDNHYYGLKNICVTVLNQLVLVVFHGAFAFCLCIVLIDHLVMRNWIRTAKKFFKWEVVSVYFMFEIWVFIVLLWVFPLVTTWFLLDAHFENIQFTRAMEAIGSSAEIDRNAAALSLMSFDGRAEDSIFPLNQIYFAGLSTLLFWWVVGRAKLYTLVVKPEASSSSLNARVET